MAESVDALVSNTSRETCAGSTPALGTKLILVLCREFLQRIFLFFQDVLFYICIVSYEYVEKKWVAF